MVLLFPTLCIYISRLLKAFFLQRPPVRSLVPSWSLPSVLRCLAEAPFEPLQQASLFHLTIKTVFLIAIASGQRRSSLQALSIEPGHLRWEQSGVRLIPKASFVAKNQSASTGSVEFFLPSLASFSSVEEDKVWCPVRALKWYLSRTKSLRSSSDLFVTTTAPHRAASKDTVSRWLVECIKLAGDDVLQSGPVRLMIQELLVLPGPFSMARQLSSCRKRRSGRTQIRLFPATLRMLLRMRPLSR